MRRAVVSNPTGRMVFTGLAWGTVEVGPAHSKDGRVMIFCQQLDGGGMFFIAVAHWISERRKGALRRVA